MANEETAFWQQALEESLQYFVKGVGVCGKLKYASVKLPSSIVEYLRQYYTPNFKEKVSKATWPSIQEEIFTTAGFMGFIAAENALSMHKVEVTEADAQLAIDAALKLCEARFDPTGLQALCGG